MVTGGGERSSNQEDADRVTNKAPLKEGEKELRNRLVQKKRQHPQRRP